ncbi:hypothetical protein SO802_018447 [Lithocarpus litseifolius]|uniref:Uncharacterized protein n=1 Tax=Lithocarpus litseifolius TaxID=425828 RepID=A0AAW2CL00_9ROSI
MEKSVKQLTLGTKEAGQSEKEDESALVQQKRKDACAYMAFVKKQPKKVIAAVHHEEHNRLDKGSSPWEGSSNYGGDKCSLWIKTPAPQLLLMLYLHFHLHVNETILLRPGVAHILRGRDAAKSEAVKPDAHSYTKNIIFTIYELRKKPKEKQIQFVRFSLRALLVALAHALMHILSY